MLTTVSIPRPKSNPFGSSLKTRSYSAGSGFRFGFNGIKKQMRSMVMEITTPLCLVSTTADWYEDGIETPNPMFQFLFTQCSLIIQFGLAILN